jgi:hypothetical protein
LNKFIVLRPGFQNSSLEAWAWVDQTSHATDPCRFCPPIWCNSPGDLKESARWKNRREARSTGLYRSSSSV